MKIELYNCQCHSLPIPKEHYYVYKYNLPLDLAGLVCTKPARFEKILKYYNNEAILNALNACIAKEWGEGAAIVEREIARRGLHVEDVERRFDL